MRRVKSGVRVRLWTKSFGDGLGDVEVAIGDVDSAGVAEAATIEMDDIRV